jgi:hypothetical protein
MRPWWIVEIAMFYKRYEHNALGLNDLAMLGDAENSTSVWLYEHSAFLKANYDNS